MIKNYIYYKLKNLNKERILNELSKKAEIKQVNIDGEFFVLAIKTSDRKKAEKYFNFRNIEILEKQEKGINYSLKTLLSRFGIVSALIISIIISIISNLFIFKIDIVGNSYIKEEQIYQILQDMNIKKFSLKGDIHLTVLENNLQKIEQVSLVSAIIKGNTLVINIKEKLNNPEYTEKDNFKPIVALYDAKITQITLLQGTSNVKVGDYVKKGDILVLPYTINSNGEKFNILPMADIKGDVYYTKANTYYDERLLLVDTGNVVTKKELFCFNTKMFSNEKDLPFEKYRQEESIVYLAQNLILPVKQVITTYYEQKEELVKCDYENNEETFKKQTSEEVYGMLDELDNVTDEYSYHEYNAGVHLLSYTVVVNKTIY